MYRAKYEFAGQEGEMSLKKGEEVELVEENDNGWWLVKRGNEEGWAPYNYLEPVPVAAAPPPPPPPSRPRPTSTVPKITATSEVANASAKPVAVFPGMGGSNGGPTPWKKPAASAETTPDNSRPGSSAAKVPPPIGTKPKPAIGAKPPAPKPGPLPGAAPTPGPRPGAAAGKPAAPGQMDLAAAVSTVFKQSFTS